LGVKIREPGKARSNILLIDMTPPAVEPLKVQVRQYDHPATFIFCLIGGDKFWNKTSFVALPGKQFVERFLDLVRTNFTLMRNIARPSSWVGTGMRNVNVLDDHRNRAVTGLSFDKL
jgi:hypothetical protein